MNKFKLFGLLAGTFYLGHLEGSVRTILREQDKRREMEVERVYYNHDSNCNKKNFTVINERGLRTCLDCAGIFDEKGNGVATTDKRFDVWRETK